MGFSFRFDDFDSGLGQGEIFDALGDIRQGVIQYLRNDQPAVWATITDPGAFVINVVDTFEDNDLEDSWGNANFEISQTDGPYRFGRTLATITRKEVWKQVPKYVNADPGTIEDWLVQPSARYLQDAGKTDYKPPVLETSKGALPNGKVDAVDEPKWEKTWALVAVAATQPHFRLFSKIMIRALGNHASPSDPNPHATLRLRNDELEGNKQIVNAHIYHNTAFTYTGHRIFIGSPVEENWVWDLD